jgi:hypothetical protein
MSNIFPCAIVREIRNWKNGKGADVILHDAQGEYYYNGKLDINVNGHYDLEIIDGERKGTYEIINAKPFILNQATSQPPPFPPNVPPGKRMVQMDYDSFKTMMDTKTALDMVRIKALDMAVKIYDAMNATDSDHMAAAHKVVEIAKLLEGYLI